MEIFEPREVPLGGLRAMDVRRTLPRRGKSLIGAWCFLDHYGPDDVALTGGMLVPAHPHIGLQTVSWLFAGEIEHRDSAGSSALVRPGELNLMTAGSGISHSERSTPATALLHGVQLWVALPAHARHMERAFEHHVPPVLSGPGWTGQVFMGALLGVHSPVHTHSELVGAEIRLEPGAAIRVPVDPTFEHGILLDAGELTVAANGSAAVDVPVAHLAFSPVGPGAITLTAGDSGARLILIGGVPFGEKIVLWWNFVGREHSDIVAAREAWQHEFEGTGRGDTDAPAEAPARFGLPLDEPDPPLPAPVLPLSRLIPRA